MNRSALFSSILLLTWLAPAIGQEPVPVKYAVDLANSRNHYVSIELTAQSTGPQTELMMATWTPGSYLIREYARNIDQVSATNEQGENLAIEKTSKNRWRVETGTNKTFTVKYRLYCREKSVRTNYADADFAVLNGAATFVTVPDYLDRAHHIQLKLPETWIRTATSLANGTSDHSFVARNFDELVDSPIAAGKIAIYPFTVAGKPHQLVNVNDRGYWNGSRAARDLEKIVAEQHKVWGNVPYDDYRFINVIAGGGGGLEHDNCCLLFTSRWSSVEDSSYKRWLSLASHEFFHVWNIRRLRPKALHKYDYENEVYTPSLWIAEGITTYYQDLILARAGFTNEKEYLGKISSGLSRLQNSVGRTGQSLTESSHDAWIKFYRPGENTRFTTISYYSKGAVVACLLDAKIRLGSLGQQTLDTALQKLYQSHALEKGGYLPQDFRKICSELAGEDLNNWFANAVDSTNELDFQVLCDCYGLNIGELKPAQLKQEADASEKKDPSEFEEAPKTDETTNKKPVAEKGKNEKPGDAWLGAVVGTTGVISSIELDSPASKTRLGIDDELIAINDMRLRGDLSTRLKRFKPGDNIDLLVSRDGQIEEINVVLEAKPKRSTWSISVNKNATDEQTARRKAWLGISDVEPAKSE